MIFSPPKHIVTKRKLNFSDSPDTNSVKPLRRRRKLIKVVFCCDNSLTAIVIIVCLPLHRDVRSLRKTP